jgi:hypothetical protein
MENSVKQTAMSAPSNTAGVVGTAGVAGVAAIPWVLNLELLLRIGVDILTIVAVCLTIRHYWRMSKRS